ncbi:collagen binding domain-containing protein [Streptococcus sp. ZJ93]|uniref:MSCRAMM family protein n=1 Tax=Streptococcus handemini TaxID=3161188 RepID=UPI0032EC41D7
MKMWKILGLLLTSVMLGLVGRTTMIDAEEALSRVTIVSPAGQLDAQYQVFDVGEEETLESLQGRSKEVLEKAYPFVATTSSPEAGRQIVSVGKGNYYILALSADKQQIRQTIAPMVVRVTDVHQNHLLYAKPHHPTGDGELFKYELKKGAKSPLSGVVFTLYNQDGQAVRVKGGRATLDADGITELETDAAGLIHIAGLVEGTYTFKETKALPGYRLTQREFVLTIKAGRTSKVEVENIPTEEGGIRFRKIAPEKKSLRGAVFDVLDRKKQVIGRVISGEDGYFEVTGLSYGEYFLKEVEAPIVDGVSYQLLERAVPFAITATSYTDGTILEIVNQPTPPFPGLPPLLPRTGEEMMSWLACIGGVIVAVVWFTRRKTQNDEKK